MAETDLLLELRSQRDQLVSRLNWLNQFNVPTQTEPITRIAPTLHVDESDLVMDQTI